MGNRFRQVLMIVLLHNLLRRFLVSLQTSIAKLKASCSR